MKWFTSSCCSPVNDVAWLISLVNLTLPLQFHNNVVTWSNSSDNWYRDRVCLNLYKTVKFPLLFLHYLAFSCICLHLLAFAYIILHSLALSCICLHYLAFACICLHLLAFACICLHYIAFAYIFLHFLAVLIWHFTQQTQPPIKSKIETQ